MAKTIITAPPRPARPAPKRTPSQPRPAMPQEETARPVAPAAAQPVEAHTADLATLQAIEARLSDGLAGVEDKRAEHNAALEQIAEGLSPLPGRIADAEARLARLHQEQDVLPRRINAARALLIGAATTQAEGQAREELDASLAREQTLPSDLARAEAALAEMQTACETERARLVAEAASHRAALVDLAGLAEALQFQANQARRQIAEAVYTSIEVEQQQRQVALDAAEASVAEAHAALSALAEEAKTRLQQTAPDLLLQFQAAHVPVQDAVTERLEAVLVYRRALLSWQKSGSYWLNFPVYWFPFRDVELGMPDIQGMQIHEIEQALRQHVSQQQQRIR